MLRAILNKSWRQHPTRHQLYGHLPPITKTIQVRQTRHAGHCWRSRDKLIRDVLLWTPTHGRAKAGRPARTYIQQLCEDTGCCPEDLPRAMNDREEWRERVRDIRATSATWWGWPLSLKVLRHRERDTHSFYSGFFICPPPTTTISCDTCPRPRAWLRRASESQPSSPEAGLNSTNWPFQNPPNPPRASGTWCYPHSVASFPVWAIVTSLSKTSAPRARARKPVLMLHLSNPCTEPKGSQPN